MEAFVCRVEIVAIVRILRPSPQLAYIMRPVDFSPRFQRCLGGPSGVYIDAPTCTCMLGIGVGD